jgi:hypothetical protein
MNKEAILRAADWLEANPDKHIAGYLAANALGERVTSSSPEAVCFCAMGRIMKELNVATANDTEIPRHVRRMIYEENDRFGGKGNPAVITYLRELAA